MYFCFLFFLTDLACQPVILLSAHSLDTSCQPQTLLDFYLRPIHFPGDLASFHHILTLAVTYLRLFSGVYHGDDTLHLTLTWCLRIFFALFKYSFLTVLNAFQHILQQTGPVNPIILLRDLVIRTHLNPPASCSFLLSAPLGRFSSWMVLIFYVSPGRVLLLTGSFSRHVFLLSDAVINYFTNDWLACRMCEWYSVVKWDADAPFLKSWLD